MGRSQLKKIGIPIAVVAVLGVATLLILRIRPRSSEEGEEAEISGTVDVRVAAAERRFVTETIQATGRIQPLPNHSARLSAQIAGRLVSLAVKPGDRVRAGQVVAEVYAEDLRGLTAQAEGRSQSASAAVTQALAEVAHEEKLQPIRVEQAQAAAVQARATLERLERGPREQEIQEAQAALAQEEAELALLRAGSRQEEIEAAAARLRAEQADLARLQAGPRPQERAEADAAMAAARVVLQTAQNAAERQRALLADGIVSGSDKEAAEAELARAEGAYQAAKQRVDLLQAGNRPEEIRAQEERARAAQAELNQLQRGFRPEEIRRQEEKTKAAQARLDLLLAGSRKEDIEAARAALRQAEANLAAARAESLTVTIKQREVSVARGGVQEAAGAAFAARAVVAKAAILSPVSGVISTVSANRGEVVDAGAPIMEIVNLDAVSMVVNMPVQQSPALQPGMEAAVEVEALPDREFPARIAVVGTTADPQSETLPVILYLDNPEGLLKAQMFGRAIIQAKSLPAQVAVPKAAVVSREGGDWVFVVDETGHARKRTVKLGGEVEGRLPSGALPRAGAPPNISGGPAGLPQEEWVQVLDGVTEGERVVTWGQYALVDGSSVRIVP